MEVKAKKTKTEAKAANPLSLSTLVGMTESKLFGFKCEVRDGTLAEREVERRIHTFFAVLADEHILIFDTTSAGTSKTLSELLSDILTYLSPIYREADKELSTTNILTDLFDFFKIHNLGLTQSKEVKGP